MHHKSIIKTVYNALIMPFNAYVFNALNDLINICNHSYNTYLLIFTPLEKNSALKHKQSISDATKNLQI